MANQDFLELSKEKIIIFDGGMGTQIQSKNLTLDDYEDLEGCSEILCKTKPDVIKSIHETYYNAGADVVETNSFGSSSIVLKEYDISEESYNLSLMSAKLAKEVANSFSSNKYVAGSIGPTTKLPSLGHITYKEMKKSFETQALGLIDGGADLLVIETCQDILQTKAAINAVKSIMSTKKKKIPTIINVTIEATGTMLIGSDIATAYCTLEPYEIDFIGMNCATGPLEMSDHIRQLSDISRFPLSCMPNAGIPENVGGESHYHLSPEGLLNSLSKFVNDFGVNIIGGCCGTTPAHIKLLAENLGNKAPKKKESNYINSASSLYGFSPLTTNPPPVIVGERTNANGSKLFRELLAKDDFESMTNMAKDQIKEGAHILDVCTAYVNRDEEKDMSEYVKNLNTQVNIPIMVDSTESNVIEEALNILGGKSIINSINLEDGEERIKTICPLAEEFGSALVALTIDEEGMAKDANNKFKIAKRIYDLVTKNYKIAPKELIFDPLTFTIGSGDEEFRKAGVETLSAIKLIKENLKDARTILGISNISFGLNPQARKVLNSIFTYEAVKHGLDLAIVNAKKIVPLHKIPEEQRKVALDLIYDKREGDYDPLIKFMSLFENIKKEKSTKVAKKDQKIEDVLKERIIDGNKSEIEKDLDIALKTHSALDIINKILLDGMKVVGELFGAGEMQLPFVLQSAETMKKAVAHLEQFMEKNESSIKGKMTLATVKGDVHDIGKNLVDIILTNNGYKVFNIGIKQPIENIIQNALENNVHAIGMSGLLVKSTQIMKENLEVLNERGIDLPVVLGGAALNRKFVDETCQVAYNGKVFYGLDAFSTLHFMEEITSNKDTEKKPKANSQKPIAKSQKPIANSQQLKAKSQKPIKSKLIKPAKFIPKAPFYGTKVVENIDLSEVYPYINKDTLMVGQWQFRRGKKSKEEHQAMLEEKAYPILEEHIKNHSAKLAPKVVYGYFNCIADENDLIILDDTGKSEIARFTFPRQQKEDGLCLSDYFLEKRSGKTDVIALEAVTVGAEASDYANMLFKEDRYSEYLYFHGFAVETAEAMAEWMHKRIRKELSIDQDDEKDIKKLLAQGYQGSRYSFGYPACPNLEDQTKLFKLLGAERIGLSLSESFQVEPEQSTNAIIVHHPQAKYFNI